MPTNVESESDDRNDQLTMAICQPSSILLKWVAEIFLECRAVGRCLELLSAVLVGNGTSQVHLFRVCPVTSDLPFPKTIAYFEFTIHPSRSLMSKSRGSCVMWTWGTCISLPSYVT
jgi:hypothetical protein